MKRILSLCMVLLCVLFGTAYAEESHSVLVYGTEMIVSDAQPMAYAKATLSEGVTSVALSTADDSNISLALQNDALTLTLNNVTLAGDAADGIRYDGEKAFTVNGVGTNSIIVTGYQKNGIISKGKLTVGGTFSRMSASGSAAYAVVCAENSVTIDSTAKISHIDGTLSGICSMDGDLIVAGQVGSIGAHFRGSDGLYLNNRTESSKTIIITGSIDSIQATGFGIKNNRGGIRIDGPVGVIDVRSADRNANCFGLQAEGGGLAVNHSLGKITAAGGNSSVAIRTGGAISIGSQVSLVDPADGSATLASFYGGTVKRYSVVDSKGNISATAQFVKAAPPPQPEEFRTAGRVVPQTGDTMNLVLWASLLTVSLIGIAALSRKARKA